MSDNKLNLVVQFSAVDKLSGGLKNLIGLGKSGSQALSGLRREARDLKGELAGVQAAIAKGSGNITELVNRERQLERAIARSNDQLKRQKRLLEIDARTDKIKARGQDLQGKGQQNLVAGAGLAAPVILAAKAAMDFSSGMVDIQQKAGLTNLETKAMAGNIIDAARAAHQLPEAMRAGVDTLAGLGLDPRIAQLMIGSIGRMGTAFKVEIADGAAAAFANLQNLKVGVGQTSAALDIMAAAGNAGAFEVKDMAKFFPGLTAQMQGLGQSGLGAVADLSAAMQIARRTAGTSDEAGTNIQNLLAKINSPGVIRAFQKNFGVDLPAALKQAYAQGKTPMEALAEITQKATGGDLSKLGFAVEDMQAQSALRALILNMEDYKKIRADIAKSGGTVDAAFRQRELQDASVGWNSLVASVSTLGITLGTTVLPVVSEFFRQANSVMTVISNWAQANPQLASTLIQIVAGVALAKIGFGALQYAFGSIIGPFATVWGWFSKFKTAGSIAAAFPKVARAFTMLRTAAIFLGQGFLRAGAMMLANPIVLVIVAIVAAIGLAAYLIYTHWDKIKAAFAGAWSAIKTGAQTGWAWLKGAFNTGIAWLGGLPAKFAGFGKAMINGLINALGAGPLVARLLSIARAGVAAFKNFFGIKSPSRLFMEMGGHMTMGLGLGIDRTGQRPLRSMRRLAAGMAGAGALSLSGPALAGSGGAPGAALAARAPSAQSTAPITINIYQREGEDSRALADRIADVLAAAQRRDRLTSYQDDF